MTLSEKTHEYHPSIDLVLSYPSWYVTTANFSAREFSHLICWDEKTIVVDPRKFCRDRDWALAHVAAHLDNHMDHLGSLTVADCEEADYIAKVRLDRECDRLADCEDAGMVPMDVNGIRIGRGADHPAQLGQELPE